MSRYVGQKAAGETVAGILSAFLSERTWAQAKLARHLGVTVRTLRKRLRELSAAGMPLESEGDSPHVYWSVPRSWFPGGVLFEGESVVQLLRVLLGLPVDRSALIERVRAAAPHHRLVHQDRFVDEVLERPAPEETVAALSKAINEQAPVRAFYQSGSSEARFRTLSVQRYQRQPRESVLAYCHDAGALRWIRLSRLSRVSLDRATEFHQVPAIEIETLLRESVDGFHGGVAPVLVSFTVRAPEAAWVRDTLPAGMEVEALEGGSIRATAHTASIEPIARFVVGLGEAAEAEAPQLAAAVRALAEGALRRNRT